MVDFLNDRGLPIRPREKATNPLHPNCPLHLRRCCGVCVHFEGSIVRTTARCAKFDVQQAGGTSAAQCDYWSRKSAGVGT